MNFSGPDMSDLRLKVDHIMNVVMPDDEVDKMVNTELPENAPFFANNLSYYPRLQQRYNNWRRSHNKFQPQQEKASNSQQKQQKEQEQQRSSFEAELWMLLGKNIAECIKQPSGQPLVSLTTMSTMSALDVANVLLSAHLLKQKQQQQQQREKQKDNGMQVNCVLSHYRDHEMRSYMLKSDDLRDVLQRCEQQMWRTSIYNAMPRQEPPMTQLMQMPPRQWLPSMRSMMWRLNRNNRQHNDIATVGNGNRRHRKQLAPLPLLRKTVEASQSEVPVRELQLLRLNRELGPGSELELDTELELEIEPELEMQRVPRTQPSFIYYRRNKKKLT